MRLLADFSFRPIGQGCFYTGQLRSRFDPAAFSFVYDCGTDSTFAYLEAEVHTFRAKLVDNTLDLLIISHFDADHVCGVTTLLQGITCKRLVIPYYDPVERLLLYTTSTNTSDDYRSFLQNPVNFFSGERFNVDEIIIIGAPGGDRGRDEKNHEPDFPPGKVQLDELDESSSLFNFKDEDNLSDTANSSFAEMQDKEPPGTNFRKVKVLKWPYRIKNSVWEFFFYLKEHDNSILMGRFTTDVGLLLLRSQITLFDVFDEPYITELKKVYRAHYGANLNATSLVTYHGALFSAREMDSLSRFHSYPWAVRRRLGTDGFGTLLTGDVDICGWVLAKRVTDYFIHYLPHVTVFQVPHHGSKYNWPFRNSNSLDAFPVYVINHGVGRRHHPSIEVIDDIKANATGSRIFLNNEVHEFNYGFNFYH